MVPTSKEPSSQFPNFLNTFGYWPLVTLEPFRLEAKLDDWNLKFVNNIHRKSFHAFIGTSDLVVR